MGVFEYLGVILSVIMGLGVTHILAGLSKTIHHRNSVKPYWVQAMWALNVLIYIVTIWWGMFWWSSQQDWSYFQFLLLICKLLNSKFFRKKASSILGLGMYQN